MKKRTERGHGGQGTDRSAAGKSAWCGKTKRLSFDNNSSGRSDLAQGRGRHGSRAVRALSDVSALCPFLHERMSLIRTSPTNRPGARSRSFSRPQRYMR